MKKYRKKPVVIEAMQLTMKTRWDNSNWPNWLHVAWQKEHGEGAVWPNPDKPHNPKYRSANELVVGTLEGVHCISMNDYIIQGIKGEIYACKSDIFEATYEEVK